LLELFFHPAHQGCIRVDGLAEDFRLALRFVPVLRFDGFGQAGQFEMRVGVARTIEQMLEPRAAGNAGGMQPIAFDP
jgi:hypothetical protein